MRDDCRCCRDPSSSDFRIRRQILADQWRRACNSIALNLAEGVSRRGSKEFRRFTDMARGSLVELAAVLDLVQHLAYFEPSELEEINATRDECGKTVYGLLRKLSAVASS